MTADKQAPEVRVSFPFSALQGQADLQCALLLCAIDPMIGGLLIQGPRGTAKSTSARALAALLPAGRFVNLPLAASEEKLVGSLDIDAALKGAGVQFQPGLLAQAHGGVLYVDEVNLLADHLVDLLLDVSASGVNIIERDGISHSHEARVVLIGTMNPEEGELRPQLLDRFGLFVALEDAPDLATRERIVTTRLAFDQNPKAFVEAQASQEAALREQVSTARKKLQLMDFTSSQIARVSERCSQAQVEGVRADLTLLRAARAHAALEGRTNITEMDFNRVEPWVLAHRRRDGLPANREAATNRDEGDIHTQHPQAKSAGQPAEADMATPGEPPQQSAGESAGDSADGPTRETSNRSSDVDWGELRAPRSPPRAAVKGVRPIPVPPKKP
ncbi:MAG: ATP-binding protein [Pseudomonadota bacterium]